jgi:2-methylcitrate dehydratase PrpD
VVLVSAIWADHERNPISGSEILAAYAKGYEAWAQLNGCVTTPLHRTGWHPTAVFGTLAATVALASVRRLDETTTVNALGLAASFSSGVVANFGSMTKPMQVGFAVERAFTAVDLASHGVTASPAAIDGPGGLLGAVNRAPSGSDAVGWNKESLTLSITPPSVKKYPVCFASHRVVDGVLDVRRAHGIRAEDVVAVHATISESSSAILTRHDSGDPAAVATFSLKFAVAAALTEGRLGLAEVSEAMVRRDAIRELMAKVTVHTTRTQSAREPTFALADRVTITMRDGRELDSGDIHFARGSAESGLNLGELDEKVESCMAYGEPDAERAQEIRHRVASALEST